jgi:hypothetical protein
MMLPHELADAIFNVVSAKRPYGTLLFGFLNAQNLHWHALLVK